MRNDGTGQGRSRPPAPINTARKVKKREEKKKRRRKEAKRETEGFFNRERGEEKGTEIVETIGEDKKNRGDIDREERFRERQTVPPRKLKQQKNKKEAGENRGRKGRKTKSRKLTRKTETRKGDRHREEKIGRANRQEGEKTQMSVSLRRREDSTVVVIGLPSRCHRHLQPPLTTTTVLSRSR